MISATYQWVNTPAASWNDRFKSGRKSLIILLFGILAGVPLGYFFKVVAVFPATLVVATAYGWLGTGGHMASWTSVGGLLLLVVGLQGGYILGCLCMQRGAEYPRANRS